MGWTYGQEVTIEPRRMPQDAGTTVPVPPDDLPSTCGQLRAAGYQYRTVKEELRDNLLARMRDGVERFPGIVGFDDTVLPEVERAILAGHDMVLLGERGQGKTRLIRTLVQLLDEWTPVIAGSELNEHPYAPLTPASRRLAAELGERSSGRVAPSRRSVRREARHAGHERRGPDRRRRPGPHR